MNCLDAQNAIIGEFLVENRADIVAKKARETFEAIRKLRKTMSQDRKWQKDLLDSEIKKLQDQWWEDVKGYFGHGK